MSTATISGQIQTRHDTAQNWAVENPILLAGELGLETDTGNGKFGDGTTTWNNLKYAFQRNNTRNIEYIVGTQTATTGAFTGVTVDDTLYDGKCINYKLPYAGSGNATLNLTLAGGTTTGAKPIYVSNTTRLTTHKGAGQIFMMTYNLAKDCWQCDDYWSNSDTYDRTLINDVCVTAGMNGIKMYSLVMQLADGKWESFTTTSGEGTTKTKNTSGFMLGKLWRYSNSADVTSGSLTTNDRLYDCQQFDFRYSSNCGTTLTARKSVYIVGTIGNDGLFYLDDTWWTQTLPTTEDGKVYIYVGDAYSTYQVYLVASNTVYWYKDGAFREYAYATSSGGSVAWNDVTGKPTFSTVATSGSYNDLSDKPTIPSAYTLPTASSSVLGGIKVGTNLSISNGVLSATDTKDWASITGKPNFATVATSGSYNDLSNKPTIPSAYTLPTASSTTLGGIKVGTNLSISNGVLSATDTKAWADITGKPTFATVAISGSYNDLSNKPTIPSAYTLPTASSSTLGGVKVGTNLSISNGVLSATDTTYSNATTSTAGLMSATDKTTLDGVASTYLPLSGGTMTGDLDLTHIKNSGTDAVRITGGTDFNPSTGAMLTLFHKDHTNAGGFRLFANSGGTSKILEGKTDGSLEWGGWSIPAGYLGDAPSNTSKTFALPADGTYLVMTAHNSTAGTNSVWLVSLGSGAFKMAGGSNITMTTSGRNITVKSTSGAARVYYIILNTLS